MTDGGWDRFGSGSSGAGPDWLADADGADGSARAAADTPPTWAELVAAEQAAEAAAGADAETSPSSAELVAAEKTGAEAGPVRDWSKPKPESTRASGSGSGKKRSGFGESGGSGFGSLSGAKKTAKKPSSAGGQRSDSRQRSHFRDRASSESEPAAKKPQSREKLEQRAKNILLYHLGRSMRTRSQLAERLKKKDIPDDVAEAVLDRFEDLHLLDDAQYAETFVRSRHEERGLAKRALGYELRKRGIDNEVAEEALATLDEDQEAARARRLVDTRLRSTAGLDPQVRIRRLVGMLARKGYSSSVAMRVIRDAIAEEGERLDAELAESLEDPGFD